MSSKWNWRCVEGVRRIFAVIATDAMIADMRASSYCIAGQSAESPKLATDVNLDSGSTVVPGIQEIEEDANGAAKP